VTGPYTPKSKFTNIFDTIKAKRDDSNVVDETNVTTKIVDKVQETVTQTKTKFTNIFDAIKSRRDDSHVVDSSNKQKDVPQVKEDILGGLIEDANILTDQEILEKVKDTFSDNQPIASSSKVTEEVTVSDNQLIASIFKVTVEDKPSSFSELFKKIKSKRREYGTQVLETKEELLKQVETEVNTSTIVIDEALPEILESVKGLKREVSKEELFNVGLSPKL
jgi:hypothetical protein